MFEMIKKWYQRGIWKKKQVRDAVAKYSSKEAEKGAKNEF